MSSKTKQRQTDEKAFDDAVKAAERRGASEAEIAKIINDYLDKYLETNNAKG